MTLPNPRLDPRLVTSVLGSDAALLGVGTFGDTWKAGGRAVKILCGAPADPRRVEREVEALQRVNHENVVRLYGLTHLAFGDRTYPALEFEYIAGGDMAERIGKQEWPTETEAGSLLTALLTGLHELHESGTIHRDLKPANVGLRNGDWRKPVILDLGLSKQVDAATLTVYPGFLGTPPYMAPEQLRSQPAQKASDLFAVGVMVHQVLRREHPFYEDGKVYDFDAMLRAVESGSRALPAETPEGLRRVLDRLLSVQAHRRGSTRSNLRILEQA
ncbi:Protein kinase domain-containing protein [Micromonospora nigra]|uniref:non-specific serine/threonine protein kinase n=1 Tax=Micromonospora nigra TaxID=145857 RepID=A0A1C6RW21_9ACTN|nr:serine/threonine-protein kinase [Micromonospora nigra]SCL21403.1 Protein kinase domain-containing protein [Micromonospora nigra]